MRDQIHIHRTGSTSFQSYRDQEITLDRDRRNIGSLPCLVPPIRAGSGQEKVECQFTIVRGLER